MKGRMHVTPTATMLSRPRRSGYRETRLLWQTVQLLASSVSGWHRGYWGWQVTKPSTVCSQTE